MTVIFAQLAWYLLLVWTLSYFFFSSKLYHMLIDLNTSIHLLRMRNNSIILTLVNFYNIVISLNVLITMLNVCGYGGIGPTKSQVFGIECEPTEKKKRLIIIIRQQANSVAARTVLCDFVWFQLVYIHKYLLVLIYKCFLVVWDCVPQNSPLFVGAMYNS